MNRNTIRLAVLAVVAVFAAGCSALPHSLTSLPDRLRGNLLHISADFENVAGLYVGNEVSVLGLPIGRVDEIEAKGAFVEVRMTIDDVGLPADTRAALISPQLITNRHIELTPATTADAPALADGAHIPLARTRTPVELDRILRNFEQLGEVLKGSSTEGPMASRVLFPMLDGNGDKIRETLNALSSAFEVTLANKDQISNTIVRLNDITQIVAENDRTVRDFSARLTELVTLMSDQAPGLQAVLTQLNDFVTNTSAVVAENRAPLTAALHRLTTITAQMRAHARGLTEIVDVGPLFFQNFAAAMSPEHRALRLHLLTDKSLLDNEALALFCERVQLRSDGCRTGRLADFGPDFGLTAALLGLTK
ncbi:MCE family protein [Nocardia cyriacigeorgica]|uniref:Mce family protein n=1 Tax=Nocardia cyriacigeorgica (strain GUH-2) TaxID=1127134 RepID=H6R4G3_NOCCG|nr:MCE family protein [Nocardia cyriacigeorgica]BDT85454.1 putative Mce family protein [Nocardia cyriacigeorgica]CCF62032.1 Mce family protein [Nocardia cyriacigeorgica GUH-2]